MANKIKIELLTEKIAAHPAEARSYKLRAGYYYEEDLFELAVADHHQFVKLAENGGEYDEDYWENMADAFFRLEQYEEGVKCCNVSIELENENYKVFIHLGNNLVGLKKDEEALKAFQQAIDAADDNDDDDEKAAAMFAKSMCLKGMPGREEEAKALYAELKVLAPAFPLAY